MIFALIDPQGHCKALASSVWNLAEFKTSGDTIREGETLEDIFPSEKPSHIPDPRGRKLKPHNSSCSHIMRAAQRL